MDQLFPYATRVVFWAGNDGIAFVVERTAEHLLCVTGEHIFQLPRLGVPQACRLVSASGQNHGPFGVEADLLSRTAITGIVTLKVTAEADEMDTDWWLH